MPGKSALSPREFVDKWRKAELKESSAAQEHFIDLCRMLGHPTPAEADPEGKWFTFEAGATKQRGGEGWADVWKKGFFAWEYKGKHADLDRAYQQLLQYREALENPPLLIVSDIERILIHTNFVNTVKRVYELTLDDLLVSEKRRLLHHAFYDYRQLQAPQTTEHVTQEAAREFARLADLLRQWGEDPQETAHFLIRLLFCLFAEDIGLLPQDLFTKLVDRTHKRPSAFAQQLRNLFGAMAEGGWFGAEEIEFFDGGLFEDNRVLELGSAGLDILSRVSRLDWSSIEPAIFGTLFERSLDPGKRSQLGAHYTSKEDILLIVEPVLMAPLRHRWEKVRAEVEELVQRRGETTSRAWVTQYTNMIQEKIVGFLNQLAEVQVLDPACGSGNFLYVALRQLLDLEKEVVTFAGDVGLTRPYPRVSPAQMHGIEISEYAHELAQATIWIGYIQWLHENGFGRPTEPILKPLENISLMDAILAYDEAGNLTPPEWPKADVIIGNPPFLGGKLLRTQLGDDYVDQMFELYAGEVPHEADLVCYWFERARQLIADDKAQRVGLLATNSIRGGANRVVLERIKRSGDIFMAWSDNDWVLEGAAVNVSMVGFDDGSQQAKQLDGQLVQQISPDLRGDIDLTVAANLPENQAIAFMGDTKGGSFDISPEQAQAMLQAPLNPNGRPNRDVVRPWMNGWDITRRPRGMWIIDFGVHMPESEASLFEEPFEHVVKHVKRARVDSRTTRSEWWLHERPRPELREALSDLPRYIGTPRLAKYRLFVWLDNSILPDSQVIAFARDDSYFFGVLHSKPHQLWSLRQGTSLEDRPRYTPTTTFETFPFPWPPGQEPTDNPRVEAIAEAARELVEKRQAWLNPRGATKEERKKRTLTNLYNEHPTWLELAHRKLDEAVLDAYGWPHNLDDEEILRRLLELNVERAR
ncbi:MAG: class I SAM-dependent DNA methyltransferase [Anaerolineae bacterium]|jgi:type II restriction/modification system DNA methylase subunit YeeA